MQLFNVRELLVQLCVHICVCVCLLSVLRVCVWEQKVTSLGVTHGNMQHVEEEQRVLLCQRADSLTQHIAAVRKKLHFGSFSC